MNKKFVFRLDDISWDMNYENFIRIRDLFFKYNIQPIIGVIPHNEDEHLKSYVGKQHLKEEDFWDLIRNLQRNQGWSVALHGYNHVYLNRNSGIFRINKYAEFAGLSYKEQEKKISDGVKIFSENQIVIDAFMAPAHSLDWTTVEVLLANGITTITDGFADGVYISNGMKFVPQMWSWPVDNAGVLDTACFHINSWKDFDFDKLEMYISQNRDSIIPFSEAVSNKQYYSKNTATRLVYASKIKLYKKYRAVGSFVKHKILRL